MTKILVIFVLTIIAILALFFHYGLREDPTSQNDCPRRPEPPNK
jgi:hypothetical protein